MSIAKLLEGSPSSISIELKRNKRTGRSNSNLAHNKYQRRKSNSPSPRAITTQIRAKIIYGLSKYHSPEQISGFLKLEDIIINHESIYNFIWTDKKDRGELYIYLPRSDKKYRRIHKSQQINAAFRNLAIFLLSKVNPSITTAISSLAYNMGLAISLLFRII
jgi:IS30 family transposase